MGLLRIFTILCFSFLYLNSGMAQVYSQGNYTKKTFVEDLSGLTISGYSPYRNFGAGGAAPLEMRSRNEDSNVKKECKRIELAIQKLRQGDSDQEGSMTYWQDLYDKNFCELLHDSNPMGGPTVAEANLNHAGLKTKDGSIVLGSEGDLQTGVNLALEDDESRYSALVEMLNGQGNAGSLSSSAQKQFIQTKVTSLLAKSLEPEFFSDLTDNPAIERAFLELANGSTSDARQMLADFSTLRPVSRKFMGKLAEIEDVDQIADFIPEYRASYLAIKGEEISEEDAEAQLLGLFALIHSLKFGGGWEGLCFELAAWNSVPGNQQMIEALHGNDGEIFLCNSAISLQEVEHLVPLLYDGVQIDQTKRVGTGNLLPAPNTSQMYTRKMNDQWLSFSANSTASDRMKYEQMLSTFLYDQYFQRQGIHPNGVDFCQFEKMMITHKEGDPLPILDLGDPSGEIWNHTVLEDWRKVVHSNTLEERVRELSTIDSIDSISPEQAENWEQVQKHLGDLCEDSSFTSELSKKTRLLCAQLRDARVGPLMVEETSSTYIYECPNVNAECMGSKEPECLRKTTDCMREANEYCTDNSLCKSKHCLEDRGAGRPLCYGSLYKKGEPFNQGKYFAQAIRDKNKKYDEVALELIKSLRNAPRDLLRSYEFQEVWNTATVLDSGDYQSTKSTGPKTKKERYQGSVLVKNGKPISCRWKDVWKPSTKGDPNSPMDSRIPASIYSIEIPQCQMEDNYAVQLLQEVGKCPTLAEVAKEYTKMLLQLSLGNESTSTWAIASFEYWARTHEVKGVDIDELVAKATEMFSTSD